MAEADTGGRPEQDGITPLVDAISTDRFREWFRERQYRQNIEQGKAYFNGPSPTTDPRRHSPSQLLQCHRKITYRQCNAPEESGNPDGIFWIGSRFEEELALPFFKEAVVGDGEYVTNSIWVDFTAKTHAGELRIKGATDPVIVDSDAKPLLLTEIKTKDSVEHVQSPNTHHQAQAHAYMKGLSEKYNQNVSKAVILYGSRKTLDIKAFHVDFDPWFWRESVLGWAEQHSMYRLNEELPPADPEYDWECRFCSFKERCGKGDLNDVDVGPAGLLPGFTKYPREKLVSYLEANEGAKLTPSLAHQYPKLADDYGVYDWHCASCEDTRPWNEVGWEEDQSPLPYCPTCVESGELALLSGPWPADQRIGDGDDDR